MNARAFNSSFFGSRSIDRNALLRVSSVSKGIPSHGTRPFFSSTPLARGSKFRGPQADQQELLEQWKHREKQARNKVEPKSSHHKKSDYGHQDGTLPRPTYKKRRSSYPLAILIAVGCTYITLSYNQSTIFNIPALSFLPNLTHDFLEQNFVLSQANIDAGRIHTLLTCSFMHQSHYHLAANMMGLIFLSPFTAPLSFLAVWVGSGIACSLATLYGWKNSPPFQHTNSSSQPIEKACGASGSLCGLFAMTVFTHPHLSWSFFLIPMAIPGWVMLGGESVFSVLALKYGWLPWLGHAGHLGGTAFGVLAGIVAIRFGFRRF